MPPTSFLLHSHYPYSSSSNTLTLTAVVILGPIHLLVILIIFPLLSLSSRPRQISPRRHFSA